MQPSFGLRASLTFHAFILSTIFATFKRVTGSLMDYNGLFHNFWTDCTISSYLTYRIYYRRLYNLQTLLPLLTSTTPSRLPRLLLHSSWSHLTPHQLRSRCRKYVLMLNTAFLASEIILYAVKYRQLAGAVMLKRSGFGGRLHGEEQ